MASMMMTVVGFRGRHCSFRASQAIPGPHHGLSILIGPHKKPHEKNCNQDNGEVEKQLLGGPFHPQKGWVRTSGRCLRDSKDLRLILTS
jgi:hypothetical protein